MMATPGTIFWPIEICVSCTLDGAWKRWNNIWLAINIDFLVTRDVIRRYFSFVTAPLLKTIGELSHWCGTKQSLLTAKHITRYLTKCIILFYAIISDKLYLLDGDIWVCVCVCVWGGGGGGGGGGEMFLFVFRAMQIILSQLLKFASIISRCYLLTAVS